MTLKRIIPIVVSLIIGSSSLAYSQQPIDAIQGSLDQIVKILQNPKFKNNANRDLQQKQEPFSHTWRMSFQTTPRFPYPL